MTGPAPADDGLTSRRIGCVALGALAGIVGFALFTRSWVASTLFGLVLFVFGGFEIRRRRAPPPP